MKTRLVAILIVFLSFTCTLCAQRRQQSTPEERATRQTERLTEKLSLNEDQKKKVYDLNLKYAKKDKSQAKKGDREQRREEFRKSEEQRSTELKALLTDDQQKKYDEYLKETQQRRKRR